MKRVPTAAVGAGDDASYKRLAALYRARALAAQDALEREHGTLRAMVNGYNAICEQAMRTLGEIDSQIHAVVAELDSSNPDDDA